MMWQLGQTLSILDFGFEISNFKFKLSISDSRISDQWALPAGVRKSSAFPVAGHISSSGYAARQYGEASLLRALANLVSGG